MKKALLLFLTAIFILPVMGQNKFVGTNTCACHNLPKQGKQVDLWKKSKHAEAFETLKSPKAAEFAKAKKIAGAPSEAKECLACHTTGFGDAAEKSFKPELGVQCEACHGAGSGYKAIHNKPENKEKAIAAGFVAKPTEKLCLTCHVDKMHAVKAFDFKKMYEEIKHPMPKG
jgi:excinuclease UvrABC ATPase subunit